MFKPRFPALVGRNNFFILIAIVSIVWTVLLTGGVHKKGFSTVSARAGDDGRQIYNQNLFYGNRIPAEPQSLVAAGDILVIDINLDAIISIDPGTGNRTVVSAGTNASGGAAPRGTGGFFNAAQDIVVETSGNLIVTDRDYDANSDGTGDDEHVVRVDPATGNRTVLSGPTTGSGPVLNQQTGLARAAGGTIYVGDVLLNGVFGVDPSTGNRSVFSAGTNVSGGAPRGTGGNFDIPTSIAVAANGDLIVADRNYDVQPDGTSDGEHLVRVNPATGNRTVISGPATGTGVVLDQQAGVAVAGGGTLYVGDQNVEAVLEVNPATGNRTIYSAGTNVGGGGAPRGTGGDFAAIQDIEFNAAGDLFVTDRLFNPGSGQNDYVIRIDSNGNRTVVSGPVTGTGPVLTNLNGLVILPAPPTAANVTVGGRVLTPSGRGVPGAIVHVTDQEGNSRTSLTNVFGYYRFDDIEAGQTLLFNVYTKSFQFTPQVVTVKDSITGLNFIAEGVDDHPTELRE